MIGEMGSFWFALVGLLGLLSRLRRFFWHFIIAQWAKDDVLNGKPIILKGNLDQMTQWA